LRWAGQDSIGALIDERLDEARQLPDPQLESAVDTTSAALGLKPPAEFEAVASNVRSLLASRYPVPERRIREAPDRRQTDANWRTDDVHLASCASGRF
jgi:hypothetical protein